MASLNVSTVQRAVMLASFMAALTAGSTVALLEKLEGNMLTVYADRLAGGLPTVCAGHTDWAMKPGTRLTSDQCAEINKRTILSYGVAVLGCTTWEHLDADRLVALTMFAINVGKAGACGSQAVKQINAGNIVAGCNLIARTPSGAPNWSFAGGKYVQGLQNRRLAERKLCLGDA